MVTKAFTFPRSHFIGFDHVWSEIERLSEMSDNKLFPPHNVVKHDDSTFSIELALAGYSRDNLEIEVKEGNAFLQISGHNPPTEFAFVVCLCSVRLIGKRVLCGSQKTCQQQYLFHCITSFKKRLRFFSDAFLQESLLSS